MTLRRHWETGAAFLLFVFSMNQKGEEPLLPCRAKRERTLRLR